MARIVLVVLGVGVAALAIVLAIQELNETSEVVPGREPGPAVGPARTVVVRLKNDKFHPSNVSIRGGLTVRWVNADNTPHTVTSLPSSKAEFDSGRLAPRERFEETFVDVGVYRYESTIDRGMQGRVTVLSD